jgi:signal transduction histidine kinase
MGNASKYLVGILVFLSANWYLGTHLVRQFEDFRYKNGPLSIEILSDQIPAVHQIKDIDDDGESEMILSRPIQPGIRGVYIFKPGGKNDNPDNISERTVMLPSENAVLVDVYYNKQLKAYIFRFLEQEREKIIVKEIDEYGGVGKEMKFACLVPGFIEPGTEFKGGAMFTDLEPDGKEEVFIITAAGYGRDPRGIICFDAASGKRLWAYPCGAHFTSIEVKDLNGDREKEIILSTSAPNNGAEKNGISDAHSYVIVLDSRGKELWKQVTGNWYTAAYSVISDLDHDGRFEIITASESHRAHGKTRGKIFIFDGKTGDVNASFPLADASFLKPFVWNPGSEDPRIFVGDSSGRIWMLDQQLKPLKHVTEAGALKVMNGLTGQQQGNYLFAVSRKEFLAYDRNLDKKVFRYTFESLFETDLVLYNFKFSPAGFNRTTGNFDYFLASPDKLYRISEARGTVFFLVKNLLNTGLLFTFIILILTDGSIIFFLFFVNSRKKTGTIDPMITGQGKTGENQTHNFIEIVQGITHQLKNPISTTLWTAEKLKRTGDTDYAELSDFLAGDVGVLKQQTNHLLKLIKVHKPQLQPRNLKPIMEELVEFYRTRKLPGENIDIQLETKYEKDIVLFIDEELFKEVMVNLMENAVEAMPGGGKLTLFVLPVFSMMKGNLKKVIIKAADTGIGIDKEDLSNVFNPFFTGKPKRTGLGLTICKRIIEAHGGKIEIRSPKGEGTNVFITLPVKKTGQN